MTDHTLTILWNSWGYLHELLILFFFQFYQENNWHITLKVWKLYSVLIWYTSFEMMTSIVIANTSIILHNDHFFSFLRTFKIYSLSNFQVCNTVLLAIKMLIIESPELTHVLTVSLYLWPTSPYFPHHPDLGNHSSTLCFFDTGFFRVHMQVISYSICPSLSDLFNSIISSSFIHVFTNGRMESLFLNNSLKVSNFHKQYEWYGLIILACEFKS